MMPHNARTTDPFMGSVVDDKYTIEHELGEGGMSRVYRATHSLLNRPVAIKVLRIEHDATGESAERLAREARTLAQLESPHIVEVLDFGTLDSGEPYLVLEYLTGETLAARLDRVGPFDLESACRYVLQAIHGLAEAHHKGIVHRDLKPENLFVTTAPGGDEQVKLLDFGISKHLAAHDRNGLERTGLEPSGAWKRLTQPHVSVGSPQYMAPEQVLCAEVDTRTDVWALGVVLYELTTGNVPFDGVSLAEVCGRIVQATPVPPSEHQTSLPKSFDALIAKCLQKSPAARPQTVSDVALELQRLLRGPSGLLRGPDSAALRHAITLRVRRPRPARAGRWLVALAAALAIGPVALYAPASWDRHHSAGPSEASLLNWPPSAAAEPAVRQIQPKRPSDPHPSAQAVSCESALEPPVAAPSPAADPVPTSPRKLRLAPPRREAAPRARALPPPEPFDSDRAVHSAQLPATLALDVSEPSSLPEFGGRY